ncbi:MAG: hypothetical protein FWF79_08665 [Defluviitaleaceae bacterium]|nr:hypothetical protein [Defluviitaleaceae bacterium]
MDVYLNSITGIDDAIVSMFMSKRTWTREKEVEIRDTCSCVLEKNGCLKNKDLILASGEANLLNDFTNWMELLVKWGWKHTTMLRFINLSVTVAGLHRAGQDDWDSHAKRFNNRIIRSSTRLSNFGYELSDWYKDKIIPTDIALKSLDINLPPTIEVDGIVYSKAINGYVREEFKEDADVKRGLYMLSIPSNFIFNVDLTEWAHVFKERNETGSSNPEVKLCCELIANQVESFHSQFNRELFLKIKN